MTNPPQERSTGERLGTSRGHRLAARCLSRTVRVPASYEQFESEIIRWMAGCVMSRTEDARGVPMHRERELVSNNPSLQQVWAAIHEHSGQQVTVRARYTWINERVEGVTFSVDTPHPRRRVAHVREGDVDVFPIGDPGSEIGEARPRPPNLPRPHPSPANPFAGPIMPEAGFASGLTQALQTYYQNIRAGHERARFGGRAIGFADTLARMASELPGDAEQSVRPRRPERRWDQVISNRVQGNAVSLQGYLEGYDDADRFLRERYEQTRPYDEGQGRAEAMPSIAFLRYLRMTYQQDAVRFGMRTAIREGIIRQYIPELNR